MSRPEHGTIFETAAAVSSAVKAMPRAAAKPAPHASCLPRRLRVAAQQFEQAYSPIVLAGIVRVIEVAWSRPSGLSLYLWYVGPASESPGYYFGSHCRHRAALACLAFQAADIYQVQAFRGHEKQYMRLASAWSVVFLIAVTASFFTKAGDEFSRAWLGSFYVLGLFTLIAFRRALFLLVRRWTRQGRLDRRTVVVGADASGESLIARSPRNAIPTCASSACSTIAATTAAPASCDGVPKLGTVDDLVEFARHTRVDLVIFSLPISAEGRILQMLKKLWVLPVDIRLAAHTNKLRFRPRSYSYIGNVPVLDIFDKPIADWDVVMKWLFDKIVGSLALICAAPIMLLIALAIKLDSKGRCSSSSGATASTTNSSKSTNSARCMSRQPTPPPASSSPKTIRA
jgi:hypothetical protein